MDIFEENGNVLITLQTELKKNRTVSIRDYIAEEYKLKANQVIQVDIRKPKELQQ